MLHRLSRFSQSLIRRRYAFHEVAGYVKHSSGFVTLDTKGDVAILRINDKSSNINALDVARSIELIEKLKRVENNADVNSAVIISGKPDCFIAGADIKMISEAKNANDAAKLSFEAQSVLRELEKSKKPVVAAIMGPCLGAGLELALACHYRVAVDNKATILGLPEVQLGLLPGANGCKRLLDRCTRFNKVLKLATTGAPLSASQAKKIGIVDHVIKPIGPGLLPPTENTHHYLESVAVAAARDIVQFKTESKVPYYYPHLFLSWIFEFRHIRRLIFSLVRKWSEQKTHGHYPAVAKIIDLLELNLSRETPEVMSQKEADWFGELSVSKESLALRNLFHARVECKKQRPCAPKQPVGRLGVLGAGLMGAGIAQVSLQRDIPTIMKDISSSNLSRGEEHIQSIFKKLVKRKRITQHEANKKMACLNTTIDVNALKDVDMVIEAVFEDLELKHRVVKEVEAVLPAHAIFASNTSALPISTIAQASKRPEKFIGMHYFSPVEKMELLEIICTDKTSQDTLATAVDLGRRQGKLAIVVKDGPGFYTTRLLGPSMTEAMEIMREGVKPQRMDDALKAFGWPIGPAALIDQVGIDVACHVAETLSKAFPSRMNTDAMQPLKDLMSRGHLGVKTGQGIYDHMGSNKLVSVQNALYSLIFSKYTSSAKEEITPERMQQRLFCRFVNEAVMCLQEGILVNGPIEGDAGAVFGLGFPPYLGGPFCYLDLHGAASIVKQMEELMGIYGDRFKPCQLLLDHAKDETKRFHKSA